MSRALSFSQMTPQLLATVGDAFEKLLRNGYFTEEQHAFMCKALFKCDDAIKVIAVFEFKQGASNTSDSAAVDITPVHFIKAEVPSRSSLSAKTEVVGPVPSSFSKAHSESATTDISSAIFANKCAEMGIKAGTPVGIIVSVKENDIKDMQTDVEESGSVEHEVVLLCDEKDDVCAESLAAKLCEDEAIHCAEVATEVDQDTSEDQIVVPIAVIQPQEQELKAGNLDDITQVSEPVERVVEMKESEVIANDFQESAQGLVVDHTGLYESVPKAQEVLQESSVTVREEVTTNSGAQPVTPANTSPVSAPVLKFTPTDSNAEMMAWCRLSPQEREAKRAEKQAARLLSPIKFGATHRENKDIVPWKFNAAKADKDLMEGAARERALQPDSEIVYVDIYKEVKVTEDFERVKAASPSIVRESISALPVGGLFSNTGPVKVTSQIVAQTSLTQGVIEETASLASATSGVVSAVSSPPSDPKVSLSEATEPKKQEKYFGRPVFNQDGDILGASAPPLASDNRGRKILENWGYKTGGGLGKHNSGVLDPTPQTIKNTKAGLGMDLKAPGVPTPFTLGPQQAWDTHTGNGGLTDQWDGLRITRDSSNVENHHPNSGPNPLTGTLSKSENPSPKNNSALKSGSISDMKKPHNRAMVVRLRYEGGCKPSGRRGITFNSRTGGYGGKAEKRGKTYHSAGMALEARENRCGGDGLLATERGDLLEVIEQRTDCQYLVKQKFGAGLQGVIKVCRMDMSASQFESASIV